MQTVTILKKVAMTVLAVSAIPFVLALLAGMHYADKYLEGRQ